MPDKMRPRLADLFCKAGGAGMGYYRAGFEVVGVDIEPQPNYPFEFVQADALEFPLNGFDAVHASPPCQAYSVLQNVVKNRREHPDLVEPTREKLFASGLPYAIENVVGAPLLNPVMLCGSSFGLGVRRHRLFESNVPMMSMPCYHHGSPPQFPAATNRRKNSRRTVEVGVWRIPLNVQREAMGIDWMTLAELSQAIPPAYTEHVGGYLMTAVRALAAA